MAWNIPANTDDLAWLAGFFDGEGSVGVYEVFKAKEGCKQRSRGSFLKVCIVQAVPEPLVWCKTIWGGRLQKRKQSPKAIKNSGCVYQWDISNAKALPFLEAICPYVKVKKSQVDLAIQFQKTKGGRGIPLNSERLIYEKEARDNIRLMKRIG
jgi:hypothetical protein